MIESSIAGQYKSGQYTNKLYSLEQKVSPFWRKLMPAGSLDFEVCLVEG